MMPRRSRALRNRLVQAMLAGALIATSVAAAAAAAKPGDIDMRLALRDTAVCAIADAPAAVKRLLDANIGKASNRFMVDIAMSGCVNSKEVLAASSLLRGAIMAELYRRQFTAGAPAPTMPIEFADGIPAKDRQGQSYAALLTFADCVAMRQPEAARGSVMAEPGSAADTAAYDALTPALGPCLIQGQEITLTKAALDAALGEVLYRHAVAAAPSPRS